MKRFALVALLAAAAANAQVYEWKDDKGKTHYSDKPPIGVPRAPRTIDSQPAATGNSTPKSLADRELEFRKRQKDAQDNAEKANKEQTASVEKKANCTNARRMLEALESGERIALRDDKGERYYMDDSQRQQESAKARQAIKSNCQP